MLVGEEACDAGTLTSHLQSQYSASTNGESNGLGLLTIPRETLEAKLQEWGETCFAPAGSHTEPCQQGNEDSAEDTARLVLVIILPILLCFIWSAVFCVKRLRKASGRTLFGQVKPPMEGPDSTLVVSDIEQSTALWEQLDEAVMDKAIALHHSCFRTYIFKHKGYEAQMEGDSFIIAFHDPQSAADFCIAVQAALLTLDWPIELLELERCRPIYMSRMTTSYAEPDAPGPPSQTLTPPPAHKGSPPEPQHHEHSRSIPTTDTDANHEEHSGTHSSREVHDSTHPTTLQNASKLSFEFQNQWSAALPSARPGGTEGNRRTKSGALSSADLYGTDGRDHPSPQGSPSSRTPSYISGNFSTRTRRRRRASGLSSSDLGSIRGQHEAHSISHQSGSLNNIPAAAAAVTGESQDARTSNSTRISPDIMLGSSLEDERGRDINRWRQLHGSLLRELNGQPSVASSVQSQPYTRWPSTVGSMHSPQRSSMYAPSPPTPSAVDLQPERNSLSDIFGQSRIREVSVAGYIPDVLGVRSSSNVATAAPAPASVVQNCPSNGAGDNIEEAAAATSCNAAGKGASTDAKGSGKMGAAAGAAAAAPPCPPSPPFPPAPAPPPSHSPGASRSSAPFHLGQHQSRYQSANAHPERSSSPAAPLNTTDAAPASAAAELKGRHHKVRSAPHPSVDTDEPSPLRLHAFPPQQLAAHAATACAVAPGIAAAVKKERQRGRVHRQISEQLLIPQCEHEGSSDSSQTLPNTQGFQIRRASWAGMGSDMQQSPEENDHQEGGNGGGVGDGNSGVLSIVLPLSTQGKGSGARLDDADEAHTMHSHKSRSGQLDERRGHRSRRGSVHWADTKQGVPEASEGGVLQPHGYEHEPAQLPTCKVPEHRMSVGSKGLMPLHGGNSWSWHEHQPAQQPTCVVPAHRMSVGSRADSEEPSFNVGGDWMCRSSARRESVEARERNSSFLSVVDLQPQSQGRQQQQQQQPQQHELLPTEDWVAAPAGLQHGDINTQARPFAAATLSQSQVSNDGVPWRRSTSQDNVDASHHPSSSTPTAFSTQTALDAYYRPSPKLSGQGAAPESDQSESSSSLFKALKFMRDVSDVGLMQELSLRQPIASTSRIPSSEGSMHKGKSGAHSELSGASREGSVRRGVRGVTPSELTFTIPATGQQLAPSAMELPQSPPLQQQQQQQQNGLDSVLSSTWLLPPPSLVATPPQQQQPLLSAQPPQQQHAQGGTGSCTNSRAQASMPAGARASFDTHGHSSYDTPDTPPLTPMLDSFLLPKSQSQQRQQQQGQLGPGVREESTGHLSGQGVGEPVTHELGGAPEDWLLRSQSKPWVSVSSMGQHSGAEHSGTSHSRVNNTGDEAKSLPAGRYTRPPYMPDAAVSVGGLNPQAPPAGGAILPGGNMQRLTRASGGLRQSPEQGSSTRLPKPIRAAASTIMASAPSWAQGAWAQASGFARSMLHNPAKETVPVGPDEEPMLARQTLRSATISLDKSMGNGKEVEKKLGRPPPPAPAAIPMPATLTVRESLQFKWHPVAPDQPGATLVFRGLRVRMGINSGILSAADCKLNKAAGRMHYTGRSLGYAKAISDAACGGMILLGNDTHERLSMHSLLEHVMTLHLGEHMLRKDAPVMSLHQIIARPLMGRLLLLAPISSIRQHGLGVLDAPAGVVTVAFMSVVNEGALMNWNLNIASEAFALFQEHVCTMLFKHGGYLVESNDGLVLASFAKHSSALRWAVQCMQQMHKIHWPEELMSYEASMATQPMVKDTMTMGPVVQDQATGQTASHANHANLQHRGLRIKVGLDCGKLKGEINCVTGRMAYRGKYMNRASRIASIARPGQVLASADVWNACQPQAMQKKLCASSLGHFNLKGVASPLEIFSVTHRSAARTNSLVLRGSDASYLEDAEMNLRNSNRSRNHSNKSETLHKGLLSGALARPSLQSSHSVMPGQDPAFDAAVAATLLPRGHPRASAHPSFNAATDGTPAGLQKAPKISGQMPHARASGLLNQFRRRSGIDSGVESSVSTRRSQGLRRVSPRAERLGPGAAGNAVGGPSDPAGGGGKMLGALSNAFSNLTSSFVGARNRPNSTAPGTAPAHTSGAFVGPTVGDWQHQLQTMRRPSIPSPPHLPIVVPQNPGYEYSQQWHGMPVDEVEDLDDVSINFNICNEASNDSQQFMTVCDNAPSCSTAQGGVRSLSSNSLNQRVRRASALSTSWSVGHASKVASQHQAPLSPNKSQSHSHNAQFPVEQQHQQQQQQQMQQQQQTQQLMQQQQTQTQTQQTQQQQTQALMQRSQSTRARALGQGPSFSRASVEWADNLVQQHRNSEHPAAPGRSVSTSARSPTISSGPAIKPALKSSSSSDSSSSSSSGELVSLGIKRTWTGMHWSRSAESATVRPKGLIHPESKERRNAQHRSTSNAVLTRKKGKSFSGTVREGRGSSAPQQPLELPPSEAEIMASSSNMQPSLVAKLKNFQDSVKQALGGTGGSSSGAQKGQERGSRSSRPLQSGNATHALTGSAAEEQQQQQQQQQQQLGSHMHVQHARSAVHSNTHTGPPPPAQPNSSNKNRGRAESGEAGPSIWPPPSAYNLCSSTNASTSTSQRSPRASGNSTALISNPSVRTHSRASSMEVAVAPPSATAAAAATTAAAAAGTGSAGAAASTGGSHPHSPPIPPPHPHTSISTPAGTWVWLPHAQASGTASPGAPNHALPSAVIGGDPPSPGTAQTLQAPDAWFSSSSAGASGLLYAQQQVGGHPFPFMQPVVLHQQQQQQQQQQQFPQLPSPSSVASVGSLQHGQQHQQQMPLVPVYGGQHARQQALKHPNNSSSSSNSSFLTPHSFFMGANVAGAMAPGPTLNSAFAAHPPHPHLRRTSSRLRAVTSVSLPEPPPHPQQPPSPPLKGGGGSGPLKPDRPQLVSRLSSCSAQNPQDLEVKASWLSGPSINTQGAVISDATRASLPTNQATEPPAHFSKKVQGPASSPNAITLSSSHGWERREQHAQRVLQQPRQRSDPLPDEPNKPRPGQADRRGGVLSHQPPPESGAKSEGAHARGGIISSAVAAFRGLRRHSGLLLQGGSSGGNNNGSSSPPRSAERNREGGEGGTGSHGRWQHGRTSVTNSHGTSRSALHSADMYAQGSGFGRNRRGSLPEDLFFAGHNRRGSLPEDLNLLVTEGEHEADGSAGSSGYSSDSDGNNSPSTSTSSSFSAPTEVPVQSLIPSAGQHALPDHGFLQPPSRALRPPSRALHPPSRELLRPQSHELLHPPPRELQPPSHELRPSRHEDLRHENRRRPLRHEDPRHEDLGAAPHASRAFHHQSFLQPSPRAQHSHNDAAATASPGHTPVHTPRAFHHQPFPQPLPHTQLSYDAAAGSPEHTIDHEPMPPTPCPEPGCPGASQGGFAHGFARPMPPPVLTPMQLAATIRSDASHAVYPQADQSQAAAPQAGMSLLRAQSMGPLHISVQDDWAHPTQQPLAHVLGEPDPAAGDSTSEGYAANDIEAGRSRR